MRSKIRGIAAGAVLTITVAAPNPAQASPGQEEEIDCHQFNGLIASEEAAPGGGYWWVATDGGVFSYDGAPFYGSAGAITLNEPMIEMAASPTGGYWLLAIDGGVFSYGTEFYGSLAGQPVGKALNITAAPDGRGYWVTTETGVYAFGSAETFIQPDDPSVTTGLPCSTVPWEAARTAIGSLYGAPVWIEILVEKYFRSADVARVLDVIRCESGFDPNITSPSGTYVGLMQHHRFYFPDRATAAGFPGASPFDPEANIAAGAHLWYTGGPSHWSCA